MTRSPILTAAAVTLMLTAAPATATAPGPLVLTGEIPAVATPKPGVARALAEATYAALAHPDDLSYPFASGDAVVVPATTSRGARLARAVTSAPVRVVRAARSYATLSRLREAVTDDLTREPSALAVYVDAERNVVVAEVNALPRALVARIRSSFGNAVAWRLRPGIPRATGQARQNDVSPYSGGARLSVGCTTAFPWQLTNTTYGMLTAGHCYPSGGSVSTPSAMMGTVAAENWNVGTGTQYFSGQSTYRGDLARIAVNPGSTATRIYVGTSTSSTTNQISMMATQPSFIGEPYCVSGSYTGSLCGWSVYASGANVFTTEGWARNVVRGRKTTTPCTQNGDSGGTVYAVTAGSTVSAEGVHNGLEAATVTYPCNGYYTDVWDAWAAFGGFVHMTATSKGATLGSIQVLQPPHYLVSPDGRFVARMQLDGNFVLYKPGNIPVWSTGTASTSNRGSVLEMQADGNLVLYKPGHTPIWSTGTNGSWGAYLTLQNDCNLVVYQGGFARWSSRTAGCA